MKNCLGKIHSFESFGAVDGPGIRFVLFMQGCPLKCLFCHNPDTWKSNEGQSYTLEEVFNKIRSYENFIKTGGVTISGGEPLIQTDFVYNLLKLCKENNFHTAIDTSGVIPLKSSKRCIDMADMLLLDIKDLNENDCIELTGQSNKNALETLEYCEQINKPVWIRHVCVPNYTLKAEKLEALALYLSKYNCIEKVELIPFHQMGIYKWDYVDAEYKLKDCPEPTEQEMKMAKKIFLQNGLIL